ncbi:MAG: hypothetical protein OEW83_22540 [Acidimicrobiia bacterium]|nr:hypothetical protein [Acidimicrobiia bacterium]
MNDTTVLEVEPSRDGFGIVLALMIIAITIGLGLVARWLNGWAALAPALMAIVFAPYGIYGLAISMHKTYRDRHGNPLSPERF